MADPLLILYKLAERIKLDLNQAFVKRTGVTLKLVSDLNRPADPNFETIPMRSFSIEMGEELSGNGYQLTVAENNTGFFDFLLKSKNQISTNVILSYIYENHEFNILSKVNIDDLEVFSTAKMEQPIFKGKVKIAKEYAENFFYELETKNNTLGNKQFNINYSAAGLVTPLLTYNENNDEKFIFKKDVTLLNPPPSFNGFFPDAKVYLLNTTANQSLASLRVVQIGCFDPAVISDARVNSGGFIGYLTNGVFTLEPGYSYRIRVCITAVMVSGGTVSMGTGSRHFSIRNYLNEPVGNMQTGDRVTRSFMMGTIGTLLGFGNIYSHEINTVITPAVSSRYVVVYEGAPSHSNGLAVVCGHLLNNSATPEGLPATYLTIQAIAKV